MCGIAGVAGPLSPEQLRAAVNAMTDALAHRGPDDTGTWVGEGFAFGMRRLSIIDLAGGHQPMWDSSTGIGLVYNGEVYNYKAVRAPLEAQGTAFRTASDTEVVLRTLARQGLDAVHTWNGMFAVAAWDDRRKKLLLIRDRMGVKPLYYYWDGSILMFASEIKALLAPDIVPRRVNGQAIWDYLTFRYVPGPETMWQNIWKLPPGHALEWSPGQHPRLSQYWKTDVVSTNEVVDIERKTKEFEEIFMDSVSQRLLASDVPVGVMLSGGLDSSAVAAAAVELGHKRFHTFSVAFADGGDYSELTFARSVARHLRLENHEIVVDQRAFLDLLPDAVHAADEPLADLTIVPLLALLRLTRQHVKVALSGEGSDEVLAGYSLHHEHRKYAAIGHLQRLPPAVLLAMSRALKLLSGRHSAILRQIAAIPVSRWNVERQHYMTWHWRESEKASLWPDFAARDSGSLLVEMYRSAASEVPLDQLLAVFQKAWLVEDLLMKADKMSMAASVELRVPFLDYRLVEWANRQPVGAKIGALNSRTVTKRVLRRFAMRRLPQSIIDRPKMGFPVPVYQWLTQEQFRNWASAYLGGKQSKLRHVFQPAQIQRQLLLAASGDSQAADKVWTLIVLETWLQKFRVDLPAAFHAESAGVTVPAISS
jgi:asparagine synthase (glutamine-hydrolysing)